MSIVRPCRLSNAELGSMRRLVPQSPRTKWASRLPEYKPIAGRLTWNFTCKVFGRSADNYVIRLPKYTSPVAEFIETSDVGVSIDPALELLSRVALPSVSSSTSSSAALIKV